MGKSKSSDGGSKNSKQVNESSKKSARSQRVQGRGASRAEITDPFHVDQAQDKAQQSSMVFQLEEIEKEVP